MALAAVAAAIAVTGCGDGGDGDGTAAPTYLCLRWEADECAETVDIVDLADSVDFPLRVVETGESLWDLTADSEVRNLIRQLRQLDASELPAAAIADLRVLAQANPHPGVSRAVWTDLQQAALALARLL